MSGENVEFLRRGYDAMNEMLERRDIDRAQIEEFWTEDCVLRPAGILPESAEMHGHDGIVRFIENQLEAFDELQIEALEWIDAGDRVVVPIRFGGRARYTGMDVAFEVVHVVTLRDGRVARTDMYREKEEALRAVGL
ncbi:MAG: nuclear transport factor 2 family protein [Actinomycetota bacterium]|nr:nuclear transport factor 2 family protein [Actinomycetota bacterium]